MLLHHTLLFQNSHIPTAPCKPCLEDWDYCVSANSDDTEKCSLMINKNKNKDI